MPDTILRGAYVYQSSLTGRLEWGTFVAKDMPQLNARTDYALTESVDRKVLVRIDDELYFIERIDNDGGFRKTQVQDHPYLKANPNIKEFMVGGTHVQIEAG